MGKKAVEKLYSSDRVTNPKKATKGSLPVSRGAASGVPVLGDSHIAYTINDLVLVDENDTAQDWDLFQYLTAAQATLATNAASTVKLTLEDADQNFLQDEILTGWAFSIQDVSLSSQRAFSTHKITAASNNLKAGDSSNYEWVLGQRAIDVFLGGVAFRLCELQVDRDVLNLTFEDRAATRLRDKKGFRTSSRSQITRAGFVAKLCDEAGVPYYIPEINKVQPVLPTNVTGTARDLSPTASNSLSTGEGLTAKGQPLNQSQVDILNTALGTAVNLAAPFKAQVALVAALITENVISNGNGPGGNGVLQVTPASSFKGNANDVAAVCSYFLTTGFSGHGGAIQIAQTQPTIPAYQIAQLVQASGAGQASNGAANYGLWQGEAEQIVTAYGSSTGNAIPNPNAGSYDFTRGPNEDSWDCIQRLASEVGWYGFVRNNQLWFVSGDYLYNSAPVLKVKRREKGVDWINPDLDVGARDQTSEVLLEVHQESPWTALPGMNIYIENEGPATGKWNVQQAVVDLMEDDVYTTITCVKPLPGRPEPAASAVSANSATSFGGAVGSAQGAYQAAQALSNMQLPYVWGGGHGPGQLNNVHAGGHGLDCSGAVSWVLKQAGMFDYDSAMVSGWFASSWGAPGPGAQMTVYANSDHVFIAFNIAGVQMQLSANHVGQGAALRGPTSPEYFSTSGFTARNWPGA